MGDVRFKLQASFAYGFSGGCRMRGAELWQCCCCLLCLSWHGECHPAGEAASVWCRAVQAAVKALGLFMALLAADAAVPCGCGYRWQPSGCCGPPVLVVCAPSSS